MNILKKYPQDSTLEGALLRHGQLAVLLVTIAAFGTYQALSLPANPDVASLLYTAGRVLDGERLYVDVAEPNPPLVVFLNVPVVAAARLLGISSLFVFPACVLALVACSLALCSRFRTPLPPAQRQAASLAAAYFLLIHVGGMFGQREHLLLILIFPYIKYLSSDCCHAGTPWLLAFCSGVMAGVGFSLKPFFLPSLVAIELYSARRWGLSYLKRSQAVTIYLILIIYAISVIYFTPQYFAFARAAYPIYRAYQPYGQILPSTSWRAAYVMLAMAWGMAVVRPRCAAWTDVLAILAFFLTLSVFVQGKGFLYHWYPPVAIAGVLYCVSAATVLIQRRILTIVVRVELALPILVILSCLYSLLSWSQTPRPPVPLKSLVGRYAKGDSIFAFSSYAGAGFPLVNETGVGWASRHPTLWQIPGFYQTEAWTAGGYHPWRSMAEEERDFMRSVVSDIERARPALLIVDLVPPTPTMAGFDYLDYFSLEPRFAAIFARYEFLEAVGRYRVFRRSKSDSGPSPVLGQ
jgi:hypothetical protein